MVVCCAQHERTVVAYQQPLYVGNGESHPSSARTRTGLRVPLWENFLATLEYSVNWNSHPPPGFVTTDRMLLLALGYHW